MAHQVSVYIRESGSRDYKPAKAIHYPIGTIWCIRFKQGGKRVWQTLPGVLTYSEAKGAALRKQIELVTGPRLPAAGLPAGRVGDGDDPAVLAHHRHRFRTATRNSVAWVSNVACHASSGISIGSA